VRRLAPLALAALLCACSRSGQEKTTEKAQQPKPEGPIFHVDPATAATVTGTVRFTGHRPARQKIDISEDPACVKANPGGFYDESLIVGPSGAVANTFVYISKGLEGKNFPKPASVVVLDQKGCKFTPRILGTEPGQQLDVTNSDAVTHNVHPLAKFNREWNQSQGPGDPPVKRKFARQEIMMRVKCNIHNWMRAWIGVVDHPYFAVSGVDGSFRIPNLPPGDYTLHAWHETLGESEQSLHVGPNESKAVSFTFSSTSGG